MITWVTISEYPLLYVFVSFVDFDCLCSTFGDARVVEVGVGGVCCVAEVVLVMGRAERTAQYGFEDSLRCVFCGGCCAILS